MSAISVSSKSVLVAKPMHVVRVAKSSTAPVRLSARRSIPSFAPAPVENRVFRNCSVRAVGGAVGASTPVVKIDNMKDAFATIVSVECGNQTDDLLETITALKNLGLNIRRAKLDSTSPGANKNKFYITDAYTSEKIVKSARLEEIRMTILNILVNKFPESASSFSMGGGSSDSQTTLGKIRKVVPTVIDIEEAQNGSCSLLKITTSDRPGLLVDIVRVLKDINLNVVSAEVDTIGAEAQDEFFVTYHGEPLSNPMVQLVTNSLQYYLSLAEVATCESY